MMQKEAKEVRCGYEISPKLKKIWMIEIEMLKKLLEVCERYHLKMIVYCGTLLGAVRHQGFIPWDDDLDVALPRADFNKLIQIADKEFKAPLFFQTPINDPRFFFGYARLRNSNTTGMITWNIDQNYNNGIYIDVYPLDGYIENKVKLSMQRLRKECLKQLLTAYHMEVTDVTKKPECMIKILRMIAHTKSYEWWYKKYTANLSRYTGKTDRLTGTHFYYHNMQKYWCREKDLNNIIYLPFENIQVPVPANYDEILTHMYGNYMEFPPIEKRGKWHENMIIFEPDVPYKEYIQNMF